MMKVLAWIVGGVAVVALLFTVVFPWFDSTFVNDPVLDATAGEQTAPAPYRPTPLEAFSDY